MLVLTVQEGERARIRLADTDVWVTVLATHRGKARLGFEAPRSVQVVRESLVGADEYKAWRSGLPDMITTPDPHPAAAKR